MKSPSLKIIVVLLGLPLLVAMADRVWTQGPVYMSKSDGVLADYQIQDTFGESMGTGVVIYGNRQASVSISEVGESMSTMGISGPYYNLSFSVSVSTTSGFGSARGSGPIAAQHVTFEKPANHNLTLTVDTALLGPPFSKYKSGPLDIPYPHINLRWDRTNDDWNRWEGHRIEQMGDLVEHWQGSGVRYFTIPTGSLTMPVVPLPVWSTYMSGSLGSQKARVKVIERAPGH